MHGRKARLIPEAAPLPVPDAARQLGVSVPTLRRWIASGAPLARRGRRGRGRATLIDPVAVAAWRAAQAPSLAVAAAGLPEVLADALADALVQAEGCDKRRLAAVLAGAWYSAAVRVMDHLRLTDADVPDVTVRPLAVERLLKIAAR
jgi:phage terminase Nu1 subunit (DNA packaging protein)